MPNDAVTHLVRRVDLPAFVLAHPHLRWVAFDADKLFWRVHAELSQQSPAVEAWWRVVEQNRLHDPLLLDALLKLAAGADPTLRAADAVARDTGVVVAGDRSTVDPVVAATTYQVLRRRALALPVAADVESGARTRFGPLTEGVQVKKAVALASVTNNGVRIDRTILAAAGQAGAPFLHAVKRSGSTLVRPTYRVLTATGRTSCSKPNVQGVPREGGVREAFVPSPGHLLLAIDYETAELRALAAICRRRYGRSALGDILTAGGDPHAHTAAALLGVTESELRARSDFRERRRAAKAVNFGVPGGLGADALARVALDRFGVTMTPADAMAWKARLGNDVYPELRQYLEHTHGGVVATLTGRVRGGVGYTQALNTPFQGLAADGAGLGLFGLVRAGYRVVAFVHDEFLIEVPDRGGYADLADVERAVEIAREGMEGILGGVPAACTWTVARRWGATSTHAVVGDRVYPAP